jgi:hypothetical protein
VTARGGEQAPEARRRRGGEAGKAFAMVDANTDSNELDDDYNSEQNCSSPHL